MKKILIILTILLCILFWKSFVPKYVVFSNDGPLGAISSEQAAMPSAGISIWQDLNYLGSQEPTVSIGPSGGFRIVCNYWYITIPLLFVLSLSIWYFKLNFRKTVGILCFVMSGICIFAIFGGLKYEVVQAIAECACLFFLFAIIIIFSSNETCVHTFS